MSETNLLPTAGADPEPVVLDDLGLRLRGLREGERAARREARRLSRELALARRLLNFFLGVPPPAREVASAATVLLTERLVYHLDACENLGTHTAVSGWAFRPAPGWDARATTVTVLLRHDDAAYAAVCRAVPRPDVASFYAGQPPGASGGAVGLDGVGFACEVAHDALPARSDWKIVLRLECGGRACEQFTGRFLRL